MANKRTIRKKSSSSGKARHDSEIRRAKRAVSAASTHAPSISDAPDPHPPASTSPGPPAELVPGLMKRLIRAAASPFATAAQTEHHQPIIAQADQPASSLSENPLAHLARRHIRQFRPDHARSTETHCRNVLTALAQERIQTALQASANHNHPLSDSDASNGS